MTHTPNPWRCSHCGFANPGDNACCDGCGWDGFTTAAQREKEGESEPDADCYTLPNGDCVSVGPCMHTPKTK